MILFDCIEFLEKFMKSKLYNVAHITIKVISDFPIYERTFHSKFKFFEVETLGDDTVFIHHHFYKPDIDGYIDADTVKICEKDNWLIYKTSDKWIYNYQKKIPNDSESTVVGIFNDDHNSAHIYSYPMNENEYKHAAFPSLTLFSSDQILFGKLLSERNGLILHSNGLQIDGKGILLAGVSGAGKSTLSSMLENKGFQILCDDRMFVRRDGADFRIFGNWCHGSVPHSSPHDAPLTGIFFLQHSKSNKVELIENKNELARMLINSIVKPFLVREDWILTLELIQDIIHRVKCYKIQFDLSGKICDKIKL